MSYFASMKLRWLAVVCLLAIMVVSAGCADSAAGSPWPDAQVVSAETGTGVKEGDLFAIELATRPRLDLKWSEVHDDERLSVVDSKEDTGPEGISGGYGKMWFLFRALQPGETSITFTYQGSTADVPAEVKTFTLDIMASSSSALVPVTAETQPELELDLWPPPLTDPSEAVPFSHPLANADNPESPFYNPEFRYGPPGTRFGPPGQRAPATPYGG